MFNDVWPAGRLELKICTIRRHAVLGVPYCDGFGSSDGELLDLLRRAKASERYDTKLLRGLGEIREFAAGVVDSVTIKL